MRGVSEDVAATRSETRQRRGFWGFRVVLTTPEKVAGVVQGA